MVALKPLQYLLGLFHHFFLFFGISVVEEYVYVGNAVVGYLIRELLCLILLVVDKGFTSLSTLNSTSLAPKKVSSRLLEVKKVS